MAMTKKEQRMVEELRTRLALRFTEPVEPDVQRPKYGEECVIAWTHNARRAWVNSGSSYYPIRDDDQSPPPPHECHGTWYRAEGHYPLYSTRLLALKARRRLVEDASAEQLRKIDVMIEEESMTKEK